MEQFTRECLDLDREAEADKGVFAGTSMEQVYLRAARLVKRTLDVEGAVVLDVSHVDVVETVGAESAMAVTVHNADRQAGTATVTKSLSKEEYSRLQEFFTKNPEGKICEGIVPATLRPLLPQRIQYALGTCDEKYHRRRDHELNPRQPSRYSILTSSHSRYSAHTARASVPLLS